MRENASAFNVSPVKICNRIRQCLLKPRRSTQCFWVACYELNMVSFVGSPCSHSIAQTPTQRGGTLCVTAAWWRVHHAPPTVLPPPRGQQVNPLHPLCTRCSAAVACCHSVITEKCTCIVLPTDACVFWETFTGCWSSSVDLSCLCNPPRALGQSRMAACSSLLGNCGKCLNVNLHKCTQSYNSCDMIYFVRTFVNINCINLKFVKC